MTFKIIKHCHRAVHANRRCRAKVTRFVTKHRPTGKWLLLNGRSIGRLAPNWHNVLPAVGVKGQAPSGCNISHLPTADSTTRTAPHAPHLLPNRIVLTVTAGRISLFAITSHIHFINFSDCNNVAVCRHSTTNDTTYCDTDYSKGGPKRAISTAPLRPALIF
jgi:hypothetical protein